ncbi:hypothetical protein [Frigidibacter sp. MR17.24]|uniref:hypothetical protein n=1 Tax=Frigidibacter sp. MR17.24 TaxID=3127345 RepID=UPI003012A835
MSIEPIGLFTLALALVCLFLDYGVMITALVVATVFGSAAALFIGGANIPPAHLFMGAVTVVTLSRPRQCAELIRALHPDRPGFWILCFVVYGLVTAYFYPRVMAGQTQIVPLGNSAFDDTGSTVPLGPVSSNFTQSIYMVASLLVFLLVTSSAATPEGFRTAVIAATAYVTANVLFALLDLATYLTGTQAMLEFMRNARYALHTEADVEGMKRIVGSFTEASSFARSSLGSLGFIGTLWLCGRRPLLTGTLTVLTFVLALLSTSSTALAVMPVMLVILYLTAIGRSGTSRRARASAVVAVTLPLISIAVVLGIAAHPVLSQVVMGYLDTIVLSKGSTDSGIERGSWNTSALQNFLDSGGIGVGLGTVRTSSLAMALLGGLGVIGTLFYAVFMGLTLLRNPGPRGSFVTDARLAARNACLGLTAGDLLIGSSVDQGLFFFAIAGIAAARPERATRAAPPAATRPETAAPPPLAARGRRPAPPLPGTRKTA